MISRGARWTLDITTGQGAEKMKYVRTYITCISKKKESTQIKRNFKFLNRFN